MNLKNILNKFKKCTCGKTAKIPLTEDGVNFFCGSIDCFVNFFLNNKEYLKINDIDNFFLKNKEYLTIENEIDVK